MILVLTGLNLHLDMGVQFAKQWQRSAGDFIDEGECSDIDDDGRLGPHAGGSQSAGGQHCTAIQAIWLRGVVHA